MTPMLHWIPRPRRGLRHVLLAFAAAPWLAACSDLHRLTSEEALVETTPALGHPIAFVDRAEHLDVEVPGYSRGLSHNQYVDVYRFGVRFIEEATGQLMLSPPGGRHAAAGHWHPALADARRALKAAGVPPQRIELEKRGKGHLLSLAFHTPKAVPPQCGHWPRDVGRERERVNHPDFGCASQRNLALMVASSRDLIASQGETPASGERRGRSWSRYVQGESPAAAGSGSGAEGSNEAKPKATKR